jgi:hypothetical protein
MIVINVGASSITHRGVILEEADFDDISRVRLEDWDAGIYILFIPLTKKDTYLNSDLFKHKIRDLLCGLTPVVFYEGGTLLTPAYENGEVVGVDTYETKTIFRYML